MTKRTSLVGFSGLAGLLFEESQLTSLETLADRENKTVTVVDCLKDARHEKGRTVAKLPTRLIPQAVRPAAERKSHANQANQSKPAAQPQVATASRAQAANGQPKTVAKRNQAINKRIQVQAKAHAQSKATASRASQNQVQVFEGIWGVSTNRAAAFNDATF